MKPSLKNAHDTRESWLRAAAHDLRSFFEVCGYPIPPNIRYAIAFPSTGRRGPRVGECWHSSTSDDGNFEIIIRADIADPVEVLGVLTHELVHACVPADAGHGKVYREAALKLGLEGKMRHAMPGKLLNGRLVRLAESLGPLPPCQAQHRQRARQQTLGGPAKKAKDEPAQGRMHGQRLRLHGACHLKMGQGYRSAALPRAWRDDRPPASR